MKDKGRYQMEPLEQNETLTDIPTYHASAIHGGVRDFFYYSHTNLVYIAQHRRTRRLFLLDLLIILSMLITPLSGSLAYPVSSANAAVPITDVTTASSDPNSASVPSGSHQAPDVPASPTTTNTGTAT